MIKKSLKIKYLVHLFHRALGEVSCPAGMRDTLKQQELTFTELTFQQVLQASPRDFQFEALMQVCESHNLQLGGIKSTDFKGTVSNLAHLGTDDEREAAGIPEFFGIGAAPYLQPFQNHQNQLGQISQNPSESNHHLPSLHHFDMFRPSFFLPLALCGRLGEFSIVLHSWKSL